MLRINIGILRFFRRVIRWWHFFTGSNFQPVLTASSSPKSMVHTILFKRSITICKWLTYKTIWGSQSFQYISSMKIFLFILILARERAFFKIKRTDKGQIEGGNWQNQWFLLVKAQATLCFHAERGYFERKRANNQYSSLWHEVQWISTIRHCLGLQKPDFVIYKNIWAADNFFKKLKWRC